MRVSDFIQQAETQLAAAGFESARLEAQILCAKLIGAQREKLLFHLDDLVDKSQGNCLIERRLSGEPIAYIVGEKQFFGRAFRVTPAVLIPRPETEILVDKALKRAQQNSNALDIGTGSGAIAVTMALERPDIRAIGTDISREALQIAEENSRRLNASVHFVHSDALSAMKSETVDLVVSNPPYVDPNGTELDPDVRMFEPHLALFSQGGTEFIQQLVADAERVLKPGGWLCFEFGINQEAAIASLLTAWNDVEFENDLANIPRVACAQRA